MAAFFLSKACRTAVIKGTGGFDIVAPNLFTGQGAHKSALWPTKLLL
jgi:hypothetical protein